MSTTWMKVPFTLAIGVALITMMGSAQFAGASPNTETDAFYNGGIINLAVGWDGAAVCAVATSGTYCFSSQSDYHTWIASSLSTADVSPTPDVNCSSALELFSGTNYSGTELSLLDEGVWLNLSTYGFGAKTNSYKVGACEVSMTSAANGGGTVYPGPMSAGTDAPSMESGWSNRMESAYIL
jgi:hypothetical protein